MCLIETLVLNVSNRYQAIPRPGLTAADLQAHTLPIVNDGSLPRQFGHQHCSVCHVSTRMNPHHTMRFRLIGRIDHI